MKEKRWDLILLPTIGIVLGIYLLARPGAATEALCLLIGWLVLGAGVLSAINAVVRQRDTLSSDPGLPVSVAAAVVGAYLVGHPTALVSLVGLIICVFLLIEGMVNVQNAIQRRRWGDTRWWIALVIGAVCIVLGLCALFAPGAYTTLMMRIVGLLLAFSGAANLLILLAAGKK